MIDTPYIESVCIFSCFSIFLLA